MRERGDGCLIRYLMLASGSRLFFGGASVHHFGQLYDPQLDLLDQRDCTSEVLYSLTI